MVATSGQAARLGWGLPAGGARGVGADDGTWRFRVPAWDWGSPMPDLPLAGCRRAQDPGANAGSGGGPKARSVPLGPRGADPLTARPGRRRRRR
jgi:hypothetical protein